MVLPEDIKEGKGRGGITSHETGAHNQITGVMWQSSVHRPSHEAPQQNPRKSNQLEAWQHHTETQIQIEFPPLLKLKRWLCADFRETQSSIITLLNVVFLVLVQQKVVVCCLGLTSLHVSRRRGDLSWTPPSVSFAGGSTHNAYKGQRAPASLTKTSQEHCTHAHTETHTS